MKGFIDFIDVDNHCCEAAQLLCNSFACNGCLSACLPLNVNSLMLHIDEIRLLIKELGIHILAINETKIDKNVHDDLVSIDGYTIKRCDRKHQRIDENLVNPISTGGGRFSPPLTHFSTLHENGQ